MITERIGQQHRPFQEQVARSAISHFGWERALPIYQAMEWLPKRVPVKEVLGSVALASTPTLATTFYDSLVPDSHIVTVAEAQPNLAEICRTGYRLTVRNYINSNGRDGYQQGEDEPGDPIKGAKIKMAVNQKDVLVQTAQTNGRLNSPVNEMLTDDKGVVEFNMPALPCNSQDGVNLIAVANVIHSDGRKLAITTQAKNNERQTGFLWFPQTDRSSQPANTSTSRPAVPSSTPAGVSTSNPDNKPASATPVVPSISPAQGGFNLSDGIRNVTDGVSAIVNGVEGMTKALEGQHQMKDAAGKVDGLTKQVTELTDSQHNLQEQLAQSQQASENSSRLGMLGLGAGVLGLGGAAFMWLRRRPQQPEKPNGKPKKKPETPKDGDGKSPSGGEKDSSAGGGPAHNDAQGTH